MIWLCAVHSLCFAVLHMGFWKIFNWRQELASCSFNTRVIIQIMNLRLIYFFLAVTYICFAFPEELVSTPLGRAFMIGMSLFWVGRLIEQFIFLHHDSWKIYALSGVFALSAALFAAPLLL